MSSEKINLLGATEKSLAMYDLGSSDIKANTDSLMYYYKKGLIE